MQFCTQANLAGTKNTMCVQGLAASVPGRFVASGGLYALFLLLHHELSGVHHSKMASSLVSLLNLVLSRGLGIQVQGLKIGWKRY